ncbi:MAG: hypothetical protein H2069_07770 [Legionella sp.]|nr:hypothetical protein [Legionella sp.]
MTDERKKNINDLSQKNKVEDGKHSSSKPQDKWGKDQQKGGKWDQLKGKGKPHGEKGSC